jgi:hypothetical protein
MMDFEAIRLFVEFAHGSVLGNVLPGFNQNRTTWANSVFEVKTAESLGGWASDGQAPKGFIPHFA